MGYNTGTISNSYATGEVTSSASAASYPTPMVAGSWGYNSAAGTISNSYATGEVTSSAAPPTPTPSYGGGLVGYSDHNGTISNSYATGGVTSSTPHPPTPMVVDSWGMTLYGTISNSYATGDCFFLIHKRQRLWWWTA